MAYPKHVWIRVLILGAKVVVEFVNVLVLAVAFVGHVRSGGASRVVGVESTTGSATHASGCIHSIASQLDPYIL